MMQRINLSVKILVSQVNTAVLLHEELDITIVGKILPSLKRDQRKRENQKGKKVKRFFFLHPAAASCNQIYIDWGWALAPALQHQRGVWWGRRMCKLPPSENTVCLLHLSISWSFRSAPLQVANSSGLWQTGKHGCDMRVMCMHPRAMY